MVLEELFLYIIFESFQTFVIALTLLCISSSLVPCLLDETYHVLIVLDVLEKGSDLPLEVEICLTKICVKIACKTARVPVWSALE